MNRGELSSVFIPEIPRLYTSTPPTSEPAPSKQPGSPITLATPPVSSYLKRKALPTLAQVNPPAIQSDTHSPTPTSASNASGWLHTPARMWMNWTKPTIPPGPTIYVSCRAHNRPNSHQYACPASNSYQHTCAYSNSHQYTPPQRRPPPCRHHPHPPRKDRWSTSLPRLPRRRQGNRWTYPWRW